MLLVIDVGNTDICFGIFENNDIVKMMRFSTTSFRDDPKGFQKLSHEIHVNRLNSYLVKNILISSVVPSVSSLLKEFCLAIFNCNPMIVGEEAAPFPNKALVDTPEEVGSDLRVNAYTAHVFYKGPLIVIDFGTATTLSLVDDQGNFCGVVISPGINLSLRALHQATAKLPQIAFQKPRHVIGTNTIDAMQSGIFWGYVALIEGLVRRIEEENKLELPDPKIKVVATGGLSAHIAPYCLAITFTDSNLTLKGLALIYKKMLKGK